MKPMDVKAGRRLLTEWANAKAKLNGLGRHHSDLEAAMNERNLRRELDVWLWENSVELIEAAERSRH